ncbi:MAG: thiamine-phosphate kinase [Burkholderiaceae bacterium]|nr:thiamine-phosphate kinase [Burkholderiaceae bacterium]
MGEFELIDRFFRRDGARTADGVVLGIGDDCALLAPTPGQQLAVSSDMLVEGRHFLSTVHPAHLAHKALAVNLSDLAACGARPLGFTLALALPRADEAFLAPFAQGLFALADAHGIALVGGDTTAGPLNVCITVFGEVPPRQALRRDGAQAGDRVWVSGNLGDARLALEVFRGTLSLPGETFAAVRRAMELPTPRVALGQALRGVASSAIDLSDGLLGDLGHVLKASRVGATLDEATLPCSDAAAALDTSWRRTCLLHGGDDYELLFTAPPGRDAEVQAAAAAAGVRVTAIGRIDAVPGLRVRDARGQPIATASRGFDHFAGEPAPQAA